MATNVSLSKPINVNSDTGRKSPNIPSLVLLRRSLDENDPLPYPYDEDVSFTGQDMMTDPPIPDTFTIDPGIIIHQMRSIHLVARKKLIFEGRFMMAPVIKLKAPLIELIDSNDKAKPISTIAAQTRLVLNAQEIFFKGVKLICCDAKIDCRAMTVRYANVDFAELLAAVKFPPSCTFLKVEITEN